MQGVAKHYFAQGSTHTAPHIFRIGADALRALAANRENQAIIVTGESGAGKTEAAKQLMQFVTVVGTTTDAQRERMETVKRQVRQRPGVITGENSHALQRASDCHCSQGAGAVD
eukprot:TRINITY_DN5172_c0_g1_i1.p4 TRINITY_DN5172_c0_g1~~TRINITY_DN5172_c0_g1_i1.p4  ORF type:complete len:114 (-),score=29.93 TRINITY_DN5172_c0_g1_i1:242-583(-)